ncbi:MULTISPECIES: hypothetical protein [unclassified Janthinobacterium]|uniref:hypothetical protein n=1 Tax=unclassified Janthinobacterium TaxID=2610881 RepID=UPI000889FE08|nr:MULTISPECIES: hypothetical protein [unclassified Janthinobacterium]SDA53906.1 hypothetical protein SAMN03159349_01648 [Janthinobacterium sp. 551a]SFB45243.1 hypothetical protein SAMN03159300_1051 [Janthinobacterium sp. 344]
MARVEAVLGFVDNAASGAATADSIYTAYTTNNDNFRVVTASGVVLASVVGMVPMLRPFTMTLNTSAANLTFLKIILDVRDGKPLNTGDVATLVGATAGYLATFAFFAGAGAPALAVITVVGIAANIYSVISSDNRKKMESAVTDFAQSIWPEKPVVDMPQMIVTSTGQLVTYKELMSTRTRVAGVMMIFEDGTTYSWKESIEWPMPPPKGTGGTSQWKCKDCHVQE